MCEKFFNSGFFSAEQIEAEAERNSISVCHCDYSVRPVSLRNFVYIVFIINLITFKSFTICFCAFHQVTNWLQITKRIFFIESLSLFEAFGIAGRKLFMKTLLSIRTVTWQYSSFLPISSVAPLLVQISPPDTNWSFSLLVSGLFSPNRSQPSLMTTPEHTGPVFTEQLLLGTPPSLFTWLKPAQTSVLTLDTHTR
jgi:hypothetical protein